MKAKKLQAFLCVLAVLGVLPLCSKAEAAYPEKPITILCGFAAGASFDMTSRIIANAATKMLGQPVIVNNVAGGGGFVANAQVFHAAPDGYTIIVDASSTLCLAPHLRKPPFDPWKLTPIMTYGIYPILLAVKADLPFRTLKDFLDFMKSKPGQVKLASPGPIDVMDSLPMLILKNQEKLSFDFVPYEGGAPAAAAVIGGVVPGMSGGGGTFVHIKSGALRGLVTFTSQRITSLPDIPTAKELGYDIVVESRYSFYGPPGLPQDIVRKLDATFRKAMETEDFKKVADTFNMTIAYSDAAETDRYHRDLSPKIRKILVEIGRVKE
jgi:tripartite-type tricarboxylate transporter receptor subunit TctC